GLVSERIGPRDVPGPAWPAVVDLALQHGLGPMLFLVVERAGLDIAAPLWAPLVRATREAVVHALALEDAQARIEAALASAGVQALWLKGIALAQTVYPRPTARPMVDLDVLVPYDRRLVARAALTAIGFRSTDAYSFEAAPDLTHHFSYAYSLRGGLGDAVAVELHFHLLDRVRKRSLLPPAQLEWFWEQTDTWRRDGMVFRGLRPEAHLLYLSAHAILQHGEADLHLVRFFDVHRLVGQSRLDWQLLVERAVALRWTYALERTLWLAARLFATPVPGWVCPALRDRRPHDEEVYCVVERNLGTNRWEDLRAHLGAMGLGERARLLRFLAFPSRAHLRQRYARAESAPTWPLYLRLWWDQGREVVRWLQRRAAAGRSAD
ncbi:MAG TPA: nucleotidyltransferase family protein, partial [Chloroflexota bacterium]